MQVRMSDEAMDVVVTEELRGRSGPGRTIVEDMEDVSIVEDFKREDEAHTDACRRLSRHVAEHAIRQAVSEYRRPSTLHLNALREALADPDVLAGPNTAELLRREADRTRTLASQPDAKEFLARPYHEFKANRFLFSCADEPEGYAQNRATGWHYTLPTHTDSPAGSSSDLTDSGR